MEKIEVYKLLPPIPADATAVVAGSTLTFDYGGEATEGSSYCEFSSLEGNAGGGLNCRGRGDQAEIPANLPPGGYGLAVSITQEDGESADFYGFHLLVKGGG